MAMVLVFWVRVQVFQVGGEGERRIIFVPGEVDVEVGVGVGRGRMTVGRFEGVVVVVAIVGGWVCREGVGDCGVYDGGGFGGRFV